VTGATRLSVQQRVLVGAAAALCGALCIGVLLHPPVLAGALVCLGAAAATLACVALRRRTLALVAALMCVAAAGMLRGAHASPATSAVVSPGGATVLEGTVRDAPVVRRSESLVTVDVRSASGDAVAAVDVPILGRTDLLPGDVVRVEATALRSPDSRPGALSASTLERAGIDAVAVSPRVTLLSRGAPGLPRTLAELRASLVGRIDAAVAEPDATLLSGIAFGIHATLPPDTRSALQDSGLIHLVATSGLKVAIVAALVARLLALFAAGPRVRLLTTAGAIAVYIAVGGAGAAAVRSALMAGAGLATYGTGRSTAPIPLLSLVATLMLIADPRLCGDVGFQLSFLGTLGIILFARPLTNHIRGPRLLVEPFAITVAAQVATAPVMGATFGSISLVGPLANALVLPLIPLLIACTWAGAALGGIAAPLAALPLAAAGAMTRLIEALALALTRIPLAAIHVSTWPRAWTFAELAAIAAGALSVAVLMRRREPVRESAPRSGGATVLRRSIRVSRPQAIAGLSLAVAAVAAGGVLAVAARPDGALHVDVLAVGAGSATLIRTGDGGVALVDGGSDPTRLLSAVGADLAPLGDGIDTVIITGGERAAVGGLADLMTHHRVRRLIVPDAPLGPQARSLVLSMRAAGAGVTAAPLGVPWRWAGATWRFLALGVPDDSAAAPILPAAVLQVSDGAATALILGDAAPPAQEELVASLAPGELRSELLVAPPAGLLASTLVAAVAPSQIGVPASRRPGIDPGLPPGVHVRTTASGGTLQYRSRPGGRLEEA
jgi:competence protein ComEC